MDQVDVVIIGAGVVGLAVGHELSRRYPGREIFILEKNSRYGTEISSRNSEVIHSGLYYPAASLKTKLCQEGNRLLYDFCGKHRIRHKQLGKLIVAVNDNDRKLLEELHRQGLENGLALQFLDEKDVHEIEPQVQAKAALLSPTTGIIDSEHYMKQLHSEMTGHGVMAVFNCEVKGIKVQSPGFKIKTGEADWLETKVVINAAGLQSDQIAEMAGIDIDQHHYRLHYCKGEYYQITKKIAINRLIYPPPEHAGLGIHITQDLHGCQRLGPSAYYVDTIDYQMDGSAHDYFFQAAQSYLPHLKKEDLQPDFAGVRPKLQGPQESFRDFVIADETEKGLPGLINLIGIESPGLTSSLALGKYVVNLVEKYL
jgi:L-2-hydroxyglutarate oxidase LhgO